MIHTRLHILFLPNYFILRKIGTINSKANFDERNHLLAFTSQTVFFSSTNDKTLKLKNHKLKSNLFVRVFIKTSMEQRNIAVCS